MARRPAPKRSSAVHLARAGDTRSEGVRSRLSGPLQTWPAGFVATVKLDPSQVVDRRPSKTLRPARRPLRIPA